MCTGVVCVLCVRGVHMCVYSWHRGLGGFSLHTPGFRPALRPALPDGLGSPGCVFAGFGRRPREGLAQSLLLPFLVPLGADLPTDESLGQVLQTGRVGGWAWAGSRGLQGYPQHPLSPESGLPQV